ncbi:MAG TPA: phosphotransferase [Lachnospiraceae bacterium]|nr:phosphotransferase [Lachnospiraceae bacterium]
MTYNEIIEIKDTYLLPEIKETYGLEDYEIELIAPHECGRNLAFICDKEGAHSKIIRLAFLNDRSQEDLLGEVEYIRYLYEHGASVSNVITSLKGNLVEAISYNSQRIFICVFDKAKGDSLAENNYRYREGVPITEYFYNCGKVLGEMHRLSKEYQPTHRRYCFFDKYNIPFINELIPDSLPLLKEKLIDLLKVLEGLDRNRDSFGVVHFDYSDGNYMIDYNTGDITVFDFDNSCYCWYMFDLANLWTHGVGWIQFEQDTEKRRKFMEDYFETVLKGYQSVTEIDHSMLEKLPLFIQVVTMENIIDTFEVMRFTGKEPECDEELSYLITCMENGIAYKGFFHEIYSALEPFECERRNI